MQVFANSENFSFIKKCALAVLFALLLPVAAWAQPTLMIGSGSANNGQNVCIPVKVLDFTDINSFQLSIQYDTQILNFTAGNNVGLAGVTFTNNDTEGVVNITWMVAGGCNSSTGITLDDAITAFELCFDVTGAYGEQSPLVIVSSSDAPYVLYKMTRVSTACLNIGPFKEEGIITVGVRPLIIDIGDASGNPGDLVCVDVVVESGWDALSSIQYSIGWDENKMLLENIIAGDQIPNFSVAGNTGNPTPGCMTVSWFSVPSLPPPSVADGTIFFQLCFRLIGNCEQVSFVNVKPTPTVTEVTNEVAVGQSLPFQSRRGKVSLSDCDLVGIEVAANCGAPVNINEEICVAVVAGTNFQSINNLNFLIEWNSNIMTFNRVQGFNLPTLGAMDFDTGNVGNGILALDEWDIQPAAGQNRAPGTTLFEVCFDVVGLGGNSPFTIIPGTGETSGTVMNIVPTNCEVQVIQPAGVTMILEDIEAAAGGTACVPITVSNFQDILSYQFSLNWDPVIWDYVEIINNVLPMTVGAAGAASGSLFFDFESPTPVDLPDNSVLMEICFTPDVTAMPGACDELQVINIPLVAEAVTSESNGDNVGVTAIDAQMCVLFPEGFGLTIQDTEGLWMDTVCVPVTVASFDNITDASFCINFSPSNLELVTINYPGTWPGLTFDESSANVGLICADWSSPTGVAIPDEEVVFELCFNTIGQADTCYTINIDPQGEPPVTTEAGQGSLVATNGELCVQDRLLLTNVVVTPESCPGAMDGMIELSVIGGREPYGTSWSGNIPTQFVPLIATEVTAGDVYFTIFDNSNPALLLTDTVTVPLLGPGPDVNIVADTATLGCNPPQVILTGMAEAGLNLRWYVIDGNPNVGDTKTIFATGPGRYVFEGTDLNSGCMDSDTILVINAVLPTAVIDTFLITDTVPFTCDIDTLFLDARLNSSTGDIYRYKWEVVAPSMGIIAIGTDTLPVVGILGPGRYRLTVTNRVTNCKSVPEDIFVTDGRIPIDASAGPDEQQNCDGTPTTLSAINSSNPGLSPTFNWYDANGMLIGANTIEVGVVDLGLYYVEVTDPESGCVGRDSVQLLANSSAPMAEGSEPDVITCIQDTVTLLATITGGTDNSFTWTATNGGQFVPGTETTLMPQVLSAGTYTLDVVDQANGCEAQVVFTVEANNTPPVAEAGADQELSCGGNDVTLSGTGSATGAVTYQWYSPDLDSPLAGATMLTYMTDAVGTYYLEVTDTENGCVGVDSVVVTADANFPVVTVNSTMLQLDCTTPNDTITATVSPAGLNFISDWEAVNGSAFIGIDDLTIVVSDADTFRLTVTNTDNGCQSITDVVVTDISVEPSLSVAVSSLAIDCTTSEVTLDASATPDAANTTFSWAPVMSNQPLITVMAAGSYTLTIENNLTGCTNDTTIVIEDLSLPPVVDTLAAASLGCGTTSVTIGVTVEGADPVTVTWVGLDGGTPTPATGLQVMVTEAGRYEATVTNEATGCTTVATITVVEQDNGPAILFDPPAPYDCTGADVTIDASATGNAADFASITWTGPAGATVTPPNGLVVTVNAAGDYQLTVTGQDGCSSTETITVMADENTPIADAGEDFDIDCGMTDNLDGSGSSQGAGFSYAWTVVSGTDLTGDITGLAPGVSGGGTYQLVVSNADNGCESTDEVTVTQLLPPAADAGSDVVTCERTTTLTANLPTGTSGVWSTTGTAIIDTPDQPTTLISGLANGVNTFTWTLSAPGCADYSSDQVIATLATAPIPAPDELVVMSSFPTGSVDLVANDVLNGANNYTIRLLSAPTFGMVDTLTAAGVLTFTTTLGATGTTQIEYEICNADCPDLCATSFVQIRIDDNGEAPDLPNGITPNGDGMNETLVFDIITFTPAEDFPDNEIIIFNRWGDIVFQAKPYTNNWDGRSDSGTDLPEATYYYILRLNIAEGTIYRGNVTIVR